MKDQNREETIQAGCSAESGKLEQALPPCCDDLPSEGNHEPFPIHAHDFEKQEESKPLTATCDCPPGCVGLPCCH